jgi:hypothetical protein
MHDQRLAVVEIGDQVFRPSRQGLDAPAGEARGETRRAGKAQIGGRFCSTPRSVSPSMAGSNPRRTVSTSGSSGMALSSWHASRGPATSPDRLPLCIASGQDTCTGSAIVTAASDTTHFGFAACRSATSRPRSTTSSTSVAGRYDLMNDLMSAGLHRAWKEALLTRLAAEDDRPFRHLDVAGGTGDVAFKVLDAGGPQTEVTVLDINGEMLAVGRSRAARSASPTDDRVDASSRAMPRSLPFPSGSISTATRSPSASGTCRASTRRWPRPIGC